LGGGGSDRRQWAIYKSRRANEFEKREPEPVLHSNQREQGQRSGLRHV